MEQHKIHSLKGLLMIMCFIASFHKEKWTSQFSMKTEQQTIKWDAMVIIAIRFSLHF